MTATTEQQHHIHDMLAELDTVDPDCGYASELRGELVDSLHETPDDELGRLTVMRLWPDHVKAYAAVLDESLDAHFQLEPERYAPVTSWMTLHDVCDANDFLIEADEDFDFPVGVASPEQFDDEADIDRAFTIYGTFVNAAIYLVEERRGWTHDYQKGT
jgi:hypothetical protein